MDDLIEKHWSLLKDKVDFNGKIYHEKHSKKEHKTFWKSIKNPDIVDILKTVICCVENNIPYHPV